MIGLDSATKGARLGNSDHRAMRHQVGRLLLVRRNLRIMVDSRPEKKAESKKFEMSPKKWLGAEP